MHPIGACNLAIVHVIYEHSRNKNIGVEGPGIG
jgi:hypothetical protein